MSDDEQGGIPEDTAPDSTPETGEGTGGEPTPETPEASGTPDADASEDPEASADAGESDPAADGAVDAEAVNPDAAAALAAAQAAVADAMGGDLTDADDASVDAAQASAESTNDDIEAMMAQAMAEEGVDPAAQAQAQSGAQNGPQPTGFAMPAFTPAGPASDSAEMQLLGDVNVDVRIELGRTRMLVEDVLRLGEGAVVELEKLAGDPVDVYVNGRHVAKGEVLVLNESFCVRVNEVLEPVTVNSAEDT
jgi:flagellar motor switch protein FliN/FliY